MNEIAKSLREMIPDSEERHTIHYSIAHKFLPWYVFGSPYGFFGMDEITPLDPPRDPTLYIQSRCSTYVLHAHKDWDPDEGEESFVFKRITDLRAKWVKGIGGKAMLITMPTPEVSPNAFFVLAVTLLPVAKLQQEKFDGLGVRIFTLERMGKGDQLRPLDEPGYFCEWIPDRHLNHELEVLPTEAEFIKAVASFVNPQ
jgi:hypothetical protein